MPSQFKQLGGRKRISNKIKQGTAVYNNIKKHNSGETSRSLSSVNDELDVTKHHSGEQSLYSKESNANTVAN